MDDATQKLVKLLRQGWRGETATDLMREAADALEADQRPPVSPEDALWECDCVPEQWPSQPDPHPWFEPATGSRFATQEAYYSGKERVFAPRPERPSQPVYDEEKIARLLYEAWNTERGDTIPYLSSEARATISAALVAALRGGELTREETNRG